jgi:cytochrome c-type biogenesis protein CcmE
MNRKQKNKLAMVMCLVVLLGTAAGLVLYALKQNINLFYTPTELAS